MNRRDLRTLLHVVAGTCWVVGLVTDVEKHRWKAMGLALASHILAEFIAGGLGEQVA